MKFCKFGLNSHHKTRQIIMSPNPQVTAGLGKFSILTNHHEAQPVFGPMWMISQVLSFQDRSRNTKGQPGRSLMCAHLIAGNARPGASYWKIQVTARGAVFTWQSFSCAQCDHPIFLKDCTKQPKTYNKSVSCRFFPLDQSILRVRALKALVFYHL